MQNFMLVHHNTHTQSNINYHVVFDSALCDLILGLDLSGIRLTETLLAAEQQGQSEQILNLHFRNFYETAESGTDFLPDGGLTMLYLKKIFL